MRIDLDHFETIEELERDLISWIKEEDIYSFDRYLNKEDVLKIVQLLIKKENIIKEAIEYMEIFASTDGFMVKGKTFQKAIDILKGTDNVGE